MSVNKPKPQKPRENSLEYEFRKAWDKIRKIKDTRKSANQGYTTH